MAAPTPVPATAADPDSSWSAPYALPQADEPRLPLAIIAMQAGDVDGFARAYAAADEDERAEIETSLTELLRLADADACRRDFGTFYRYFWPEISPTWPHYSENPGTDALIAHAQAVGEGRINHLAVACSPGLGKSSCWSIAFPAWMWARNPAWRALCASHTIGLQQMHAATFYNLVVSDKYKRLFPEVELASSAVTRLTTTAGGMRASFGCRSDVTGVRADCFAGGTLVSTEWGEIPIGVLHEMHGVVPTPRVWAFDHAAGRPVLREIAATRCLQDRTVVDLSTQSGKLLTCTPDHRIWADGEYRPAEDITGRELSILRRADVKAVRSRDPLHEMLGNNADLHQVPDGVSARWRGARQGTSPCEVGAILRQAVLRDRVLGQPSQDRTDVHTVLGAVLPGAGSSTGDVLARVRSLVEDLARTASEATTSPVRAVPQDVSAWDQPHDVLHQGLREPSALGPDDGHRELPLQGRVQLHQGVQGRDPADLRAGRRVVHDLRGSDDLAAAPASSAPHQRGRALQPPAQPHHVVLDVPHDPSPDHVLGQATVQTDHVTAVCRRGQAVDVYDLQVVGHSNFFAGGVLVHNCGLIDDSLNADDCDNKDAIEDVNNWYGTVWSSRFDDRPGRPAQFVEIQQRLSEADLINHVRNLGAEVLELPAEYDPEHPCRTSIWSDPRTEAGELIAPTILSRERLEKMRVTLGPRNFEGQYNQRPSSRDGRMFKIGMWGWCALTGNGDPHPRRPDKARGGPAHVIGRRRDGGLDVDWVTVSVDPTGGSVSETASALGLGIVAGKGLRTFVLEDRTPGPRGPAQQVDDILRAIVAAAAVIGTPGPKFAVLIEKKALGVGIMAQIESAIADGSRGFDAEGKPVQVPLLWPDGQRIVCTVVGYEPTGKGSKETRANHMEAPVEAGLVQLVDGAPWVPSFLAEFGGFPGTGRDDRVDMLAQAIDHHRPPPQEQTSWADALKKMTGMIRR